MSLADQASLLFIPSGYKSQKVYSIFPTDGDGDFDFSRSGSATRIAKNGLITTVDSNVPRLEYPLIDGVVNGCPSLLLENSATNLITYSEDFSQGDWAGGAVTRELNQIISPDGTLNGAEISASASFAQIQQTYTSINDTNYTLSLFAKLPSSNVVGLRLASGSNDVRREFNLSTLSIQSMGGNNQELIDEGIENHGNGWYRIFLTCKADGTSAFLNIYPKNSSDATLQSVFIYGAMLEQGSYPTSYIPTNGATATRLADVCNDAGTSATFNDSEGVLMAEISALANDLTNRTIALSDGTTSNTVRIQYLTVSNSIWATVTNIGAGGNQAILQYTSSDITTNSKVSIKYKENDFSLWVDGFEVATDTSGVTFSANTLNTLQFDRGNGNENFYGNTKQIQYYNSALTDSELEQLTSWTSFIDMANGQQYSII